MPALEVARFRTNLDIARGMASTASALESQLTVVMDVSDLLRAALVQGVSAFDHFVHEEVRSRMLGIQQQPASTWPSGFRRFRVSLESVDQAQRGISVAWLESEVRSQHGFLAFQHPDKVADAVRLVSDVELWKEVGGELGVSPTDVKTRLKLIVDRRNKIAHEADFDPTPPSARFPIDRRSVDDSLDFLERLVDAIVRVV